MSEFPTICQEEHKNANDYATNNIWRMMPTISYPKNPVLNKKVQ